MLLSRLSQVPPEFLKTCKDTTVVERTEAVLQVTAQGTQPLQINWFKNGVQVNCGGRIKMSSDGENCQLKFSPVKREDEGLYRCEISNKAGHRQCEAVLTVQRK